MFSQDCQLFLIVPCELSILFNLFYVIFIYSIESTIFQEKWIFFKIFLQKNNSECVRHLFFSLLWISTPQWRDWLFGVLRFRFCIEFFFCFSISLYISVSMFLFLSSIFFVLKRTFLFLVRPKKTVCCQILRRQTGWK
jgi:hypothetical protein